jgi:hypothetical protein
MAGNLAEAGRCPNGALMRGDWRAIEWPVAGRTKPRVQKITVELMLSRIFKDAAQALSRIASSGRDPAPFLQ